MPLHPLLLRSLMAGAAPLNVAQWQTRVAGVALVRHEAQADGQAGRIVNEQGRGGIPVKVLPQPVKVIVAHT